MVRERQQAYQHPLPRSHESREKGPHVLVHRKLPDSGRVSGWDTCAGREPIGRSRGNSGGLPTQRRYRDLGAAVPWLLFFLPHQTCDSGDHMVTGTDAGAPTSKAGTSLGRIHLLLGRRDKNLVPASVPGIGLGPWKLQRQDSPSLLARARGDQ